MILGATHGEMLAFLIVLLVMTLLGLAYASIYIQKLMTERRILHFIYDFIYAIIVGGIFVLLMLRINMLSVKYYHILALIIGILLGGVLPTHYLKAYDARIIAWSERLKLRMRQSKLYRIIKK